MFELDQRHKDMLKRQMIGLLEKAAEYLERADQLEFESFLTADSKRAKYDEEKAEQLRQEAYRIMDMFPEFSLDNIECHRKGKV